MKDCAHDRRRKLHEEREYWEAALLLSDDVAEHQKALAEIERINKILSGYHDEW